MKWRLSKRGVALVIAALAISAGLFGAFAPIGLDAPAQAALAILLVATALWATEAVPLYATSMIVLMLALVWLAPVMRRSGMDIEDAAFLAPFFSDVILLFLGGFVLAAALQQCRADEYLARRIIARTSGSAPLLIAGIMVITWFLGMWLSNTATAAMMLTLALPVVRGLPKGDGLRKAVVLAVPLAANIGGLSTPVASPPNAIAMQYIAQGPDRIGFGKWMLIGVPGALVMLAFAYGVLMFLFRRRGPATALPTPGPPVTLAPSAGYVVAVASVTVLAWVTSAWHGLSAGTVATLPVIAFFGRGTLHTNDLRALPWDVLLMMGGGLCLGTITAESGLATALISCMPLQSDELLPLVVIFGTLAILVGSFMSNTATANLLMPIILGLGPGQRMPLLLATAMCCSLAMPLPISTPPNAMAFSTGEISAGDLIKTGTIVTLGGLLLAITVGYWWWDVVGLF